MYRHTPVPLRGPFTRSRACWKFPPPAAEPAGLAVAVEEIRFELVERVRRAIAEGTYDTPEKWDAALRRLFARFDPT